MLQKSMKFSIMLGATALMSLPALAQDRNLSEAEINQLFVDLFIKESSIIDTDDVELEKKQREEISEQIVYHYTDKAIIKRRESALTEKNYIRPIYQAKLDKNAYENMLEVERKIKDMNIEFDIKNIEYQGQRALVDINTIHTYKIDATDYDDVIKYSADVITKAECKIHIKIDYDDIARIDHENCHANTFISNMEIDAPEYMEDRAGSAEIKFGAETIFKR